MALDSTGRFVLDIGGNQGLQLGDIISIFTDEDKEKETIARQATQKPEDKAADLKDIIQIFKGNAKNGTSDLAKLLSFF